MALKPQNISTRSRLPVIDNKDDQKALNLLVERIFNKPESSIGNLKQKDLSQRKFSRGKYKPLSKNYDPTGWLKKEKPSKVTKNTSKVKTKRKETEELSRKNVKLDDDFSKYGVKLPTFEESLASNEKITREIQSINSFIDQIEPIREHVDINLSECVEEDLVILDCKHLNDEDIMNACTQNYQYISEIHNGTRHSTRRELFKTSLAQNNFSTKALRFNTSMITFADNQKKQLLAFLTNKFGDPNKYTPTLDDYFFKVLLPELCLKIFMDVHDMNRDKALEYLANQPIH